MSTTKFVDASATVQGTLVQSSWLNDVDTGTYAWLTAVAGTANNITAVGPTSMTAYLPGQRFFFNPQTTNTATAAMTINGISGKVIDKYGSTGTVAGDIVAGVIAEIVYDGTNFQLLNPQASVPPTVQTAINAIPTGGRLLNVQVITATQTYVPTTGTNSIIVEAVGGGGAGGGASSAATSNASLGGGGGAGGFLRARYTTGFTGLTATIGAAGVGVSAANGGSGGATSLGTLFTANGGVGGAYLAATNPTITAGGIGGSVTGSGVLFSSQGNPGATAVGSSATQIAQAGVGAASPYGPSTVANTLGYGAGGGGAPAGGHGAGGAGAFVTGAISQNNAGGNGSAGLMIIYEYA